ncbi:EamA family transporter [Opitutaceae bacterium EW11]|nr:EamA family transporter [Opitutaceae bacterium EW11]
MDEPSQGSFSHQLGGILLLIAAVLCFSCMDASAKWLNQSMPSLQTVSLRYLGSFVITASLLNPRSRPGVLRTRRRGLQIVRALLLVTSTMSGFAAVRYLRLTQLTSITFASPLIVALIAGPLLGEKIGPRRVVAVIVGFLGVLIVTRPGTGTVHPAALLAFVAACANALYSIATRKIAAYDPPETTMLYTMIVGSVVVAPILPLVWQAPASPKVWGVVAIISTLGALSHWCLILAHKRAPATVLAPFYYTQLLGATLVGALVFHELPDRWTILGGSIVMGSGLYLVYRERVRQKPVPSSDVAA